MSERRRIEHEYQRRAEAPLYRHLYTVFNRANLHAMQSREQSLLALLQRQGLHDLTKTRLLDIGCGSGGELLRWIGYGCMPFNCAGIDLLSSRVTLARLRLPAGTQVQQGDASHLPYQDALFDIVTQFTVFSSILNPEIRRRIATEILRVLRPDGLIIWYDFWFNPINRQTRGVRLNEIKALFPNCHYDARQITLAPPLARYIVPRSWLFATLLEKLPLRTHWLVGIRKSSTT